MGKNKKSAPKEELLRLPRHPALTAETALDEQIAPIVDTHTHLVSTFHAYRGKYKDGKYETVHDFVRGLYQDRNVEAIVDVWCDASIQLSWRSIADSALTKESIEMLWGGLEYWFVMGIHPHEAGAYTDEVESNILNAMAHPRCVGWGEIGLDYHYDNSPRDVQCNVFTRQLQLAVQLGKPLTIHTREAEEDTERILKEHVPREHKIHIHCYTDSAEWAARMLEYFPNLFIGVTGVITYFTNLNTSAVIRQMASTPGGHMRILLETDAPFMVPSNIYTSLKDVKGRLPLSHSAMIPWTAEFVAAVANEAIEGEEPSWDVVKVLREARENAKSMYGI
ncbi:uncharacterized protein LAESUDRAFT_759938 [Laetiporus sulphureus 93-53]|uniref:Metallo-dependent hydrolase n=1 Tax=Laetiporus sulphureus 93-53 TaxID=1314785 RepID=A0A165DV83_9APHY|nr:uncharacterized protein LAESUDRAFT_759938 [Laetiporus sulphureus 93-53]KZT05694.1 hypothetical protein LAESUDRAFT_759938 [Laetiporus sulphureus 93-53]